MFNKNINSINDNNNSGFKQSMLETRFDDVQKQVQPLKSQSGDYIIAVNNVPLDSPISPLDETKKIFDEKIDKTLQSSDVVVIFGLGLGYLLKRVFVQSPARIILYEPNVNVLRFALEYVDFSDILTSNRVIISSDFNFCIRKIGEMFYKDTKINLVFNNSYLSLYTKLLSDFSAKMIDEVNAKKSDLTTIRQQSKMWVENVINNIKHFENTRPVNYLKDKFRDLPVLILCAGPSLKDDLPFIKQNQDKFVIIAVNKITEFLLKNEIVPDFVIASDAWKLDITLDFNNQRYKNINFIFSAKCDTSSFSLPNNSIWLYYPKNSSLISDLIKNSDDTLLFDKTSSTTAIYAFEIAKMFGAKDIVFSGLDLAYRENEHYSANVETRSQDIENKIKFTQIKNLRGEMVQTRNDYALFVKQFESALLDNNEINVYNLTSFGAFINGMIYKSFNEISSILDDLQECKINEIVADVFDETKLKWNETYSNISKLFYIYAESMKKLDIQKMKASTISLDFAQFPVKYYEISLNFIESIKTLLKNPILGEYFQIEILDFLNDFEKLTITSKDELLALKQRETDFLASVEEFILKF